MQKNADKWKVLLDCTSGGDIQSNLLPNKDPQVNVQAGEWEHLNTFILDVRG